jgi:hypothetical protein
MEPRAVLARCREYYAVLTPENDKLVIDSPEQLPDDLRRELREHKPEIIALLRVRPPRWHANAVARDVQREGFCVFWSDVFGEIIAFIRDETFRSKVPCGIVVYTLAEVEELWGAGKPTTPPETLRLIHETKKRGGKVAEYGSKDVSEC